eukprot:COSAG05_NODE_243_length_13035_cov_115.270022_5_plen_184_part_00
MYPSHCGLKSSLGWDGWVGCWLFQVSHFRFHISYFILHIAYFTFHVHVSPRRPAARPDSTAQHSRQQAGSQPKQLVRDGKCRGRKRGVHSIPSRPSNQAAPQLTHTQPNPVGGCSDPAAQALNPAPSPRCRAEARRALARGASPQHVVTAALPGSRRQCPRSARCSPRERYGEGAGRRLTSAG